MFGVAPCPDPFTAVGTTWWDPGVCCIELECGYWLQAGEQCSVVCVHVCIHNGANMRKACMFVCGG
jgi:hypothetical protein